MEISEIIVIMLVYGGLFMYTIQSISSKNKILVYVKSAFVLILYSFIATIIWLTFKGEEYHINHHSGYEPISYSGEAIFMIVGLSIYSLILLMLNMQFKKRHSIKS